MKNLTRDRSANNADFIGIFSLYPLTQHPSVTPNFLYEDHQSKSLA
jgi:hypothetical protein